MMNIQTSLICIRKRLIVYKPFLPVPMATKLKAAKIMHEITERSRHVSP